MATIERKREEKEQEKEREVVRPVVTETHAEALAFDLPVAPSHTLQPHASVQAEQADVAHSVMMAVQEHLAAASVPAVEEESSSVQEAAHMLLSPPRIEVEEEETESTQLLAAIMHQPEGAEEVASDAATVEAELYKAALFRPEVASESLGSGIEEVQESPRQMGAEPTLLQQQLDVAAAAAEALQARQEEAPLYPDFFSMMPQMAPLTESAYESDGIELPGEGEVISINSLVETQMEAPHSSVELSIAPYEPSRSMTDRDREVEHDQLRDMLTAYYRSEFLFSRASEEFHSLANAADVASQGVWVMQPRTEVTHPTCSCRRPLTLSINCDHMVVSEPGVGAMEQALAQVQNCYFQNLTYAAFQSRVHKLKIVAYLDSFLHSSSFETLQSENMVVLLDGMADDGLATELRRLISVLSILFEFEQGTNRPQDREDHGSFRADLRGWIGDCVAVLLRSSASSHHQAILHHLVRTPNCGTWGACFVQFPPYWTNDVASHMIKMLSILLSPVPQAEVTARTAGDAGHFLLEEADYVMLLNQFPFHQMFGFIFDPEQHSKGGVLFETCDYILHLLAAALEIFSSNKHMVELLASLLKLCVRYAAVYVSKFGDNASPSWKRALVGLMMFAIKALIDSKVVNLWQFVVGLPFHDIPSEATWSIFLELYRLPPDQLPGHLVEDPTAGDGTQCEHGTAVRYVSMTYSDWRELLANQPELRQPLIERLTDNPASVFLLHALESVACARSTPLDLALVVANELFHVAFLTKETWSDYHKPVRGMLRGIAQAQPEVTSLVLQLVDASSHILGKGAMYIVSDLPLRLHQPDVQAEFPVLHRWLQCPFESTEHALAKHVIESLTWSRTASGDLFLSVETHRQCALLLGHAYVHHLVPREGERKAMFFNSALKKGEEEFSAWCWEALMKCAHVSRNGMPLQAALDRHADEVAVFHQVAAHIPDDQRLVAVPLFVLFVMTDLGLSAAKFRASGARLLGFLLDQDFHPVVIRLLLDLVPHLLKSGLEQHHSEQLVAEADARAAELIADPSSEDCCIFSPSLPLLANFRVVERILRKGTTKKEVGEATHQLAAVITLHVTSAPDSGDATALAHFWLKELFGSTLWYHSPAALLCLDKVVEVCLSAGLVSVVLDRLQFVWQSPHFKDAAKALVREEAQVSYPYLCFAWILKEAQLQHSQWLELSRAIGQEGASCNVAKLLKAMQMKKTVFAISLLAGMIPSLHVAHPLQPLLWQVVVYLSSLPFDRKVQTLLQRSGTPGYSYLMHLRMVDPLVSHLHAATAHYRAQELIPAARVEAEARRKLFDCILSWYQPMPSLAHVHEDPVVAPLVSTLLLSSIVADPGASLWTSVLASAKDRKPAVRDVLEPLSPSCQQADALVPTQSALELRSARLIQHTVSSLDANETNRRHVPPPIRPRLPPTRYAEMDQPGVYLPLETSNVVRAVQRFKEKEDRVTRLHSQLAAELKRLYVVQPRKQSVAIPCTSKKCPGISAQINSSKSVIHPETERSLAERRAELSAALDVSPSALIDDQLCHVVLRIQQAVEELVTRLGYATVASMGGSGFKSSSEANYFEDLLFKGKQAFFSLLYCLATDVADVQLFPPTATFLEASLDVLGKKFVKDMLDPAGTLTLLHILRSAPRCFFAGIHFANVLAHPSTVVEYLDCCVAAVSEVGYREVEPYLSAFSYETWLSLPLVQGDLHSLVSRLQTWIVGVMSASSSTVTPFLRDLFLNCCLTSLPVHLHIAIGLVSSAALMPVRGSQDSRTSVAAVDVRDRSHALLLSVIGTAVKELPRAVSPDAILVTAKKFSYHFWKVRKETGQPLFAAFTRPDAPTLKAVSELLLACTSSIMASLVSASPAHQQQQRQQANASTMVPLPAMPEGAPRATGTGIEDAWAAVVALFGPWLSTVVAEDGDRVLMAWEQQQRPMASLMVDTFVSAIFSVIDGYHAMGAVGSHPLKLLWTFYMSVLIPGARNYEHELISPALARLCWNEHRDCASTVADIHILAQTSLMENQLASGLLHHMLLSLPVKAAVDSCTTGRSHLLSAVMSSYVAFVQAATRVRTLLRIKEQCAILPWYWMEEADYHQVAGPAMTLVVAHLTTASSLQASPHLSSRSGQASRNHGSHRAPHHSAPVPRPLQVLELESLFDGDLDVSAAVTLDGGNVRIQEQQRAFVMLKILGCAGTRQLSSTVKAQQDSQKREFHAQQQQAVISSFQGVEGEEVVATPAALGLIERKEEHIGAETYRRLMQLCARKEGHFFKALSNLVVTAISQGLTPEAPGLLRQVVVEDAIFLVRAAQQILEECDEALFDHILQGLFRLFNHPDALRITQIAAITGSLLLSQGDRLPLAVMRAAGNTVAGNDILALVIERSVGKYFATCEGWEAVIAAVTMPDIGRKEFLDYCASRGYGYVLYIHIKQSIDRLENSAEANAVASHSDVVLGALRWSLISADTYLQGALWQNDPEGRRKAEHKLVLLWVLTIQLTDLELLVVSQQRNNQAVSYLLGQLMQLAEFLLKIAGPVKKSKRGLFSRSTDDSQLVGSSAMHLACRMLGSLVQLRVSIPEKVRKESVKELTSMSGNKAYANSLGTITRSLPIVLAPASSAQMSVAALDLLSVLHLELWPHQNALRRL